MLQLVASADFEKWLDGLRDGQARMRIIARLRLTRRGSVVVVLLCGGDKSTQAKDIAKARAIAEEWKG